MQISPYQSDIVRTNYKPFQHNLELIAGVLDYKQKTFDSNYKALQGLKQQSLGIDFLNKDRQSVIDGYNKRINDHFTKFKELGDLTNSNTLNGHMEIFNELQGRTDLIRDYKFDSGIRKEMGEVYKRANGKDPLKNGIHAMNLANYSYEIEKYKNATGELPNVPKYVNYVDVNKLAREAALEIPEEEITRFINDGNGNLIEQTTKMRDPAKVKAVISDIIAQNGQPQLLEEAKYNYRNNKNNPAYLAQLLDESQNHLLTQKNLIQEQLKGLKEDTSVEALSTQEALKKQLSVLDKKIFQEVSDIDDDVLISRLAQVHTSETLDKLSNSYSYKNVSQELKLDPVWSKVQSLRREDKKIGISLAKLQLDQKGFELDKAEFGLKQMELLGTGNPKGIPVNQQDNSEVVNEVLNNLADKALKAPKAQKDIFALGLSNKDLNISNNRKIELENFLINNSRYEMRSIPGMPKKLEEAQAELDKIRTEGLDHVASKEIWVKNIIKDISHYDKYPSIQDNYQISAAKEAIEVLRINSEKITVASVEAKAKELLNDPSSDAYERKKDIERYANGFKEVMRLSGASQLKEPKAQRKALIKYLKVEDFVNTHKLTQNNLDLSKINGKITKQSQVNINNLHKDYISANVKWSPDMREIGGYVPLIPRQIENESLSFVLEENDGLGTGYKEYTFKKDFFKDENGGFDKQYYTIDNAGVTQKIDKDNPVLKVGSLDTELEIEKNIRDFILPPSNTGSNEEDINGVPVHLSKMISTGNVVAKVNHPEKGEFKITFKPARGKAIIETSQGTREKTIPIGISDSGIRELLNKDIK